MKVNVYLIPMIVGDSEGWLQSYDLEADDGRGRVTLTAKREDAMTFDDAGAALKAYKSSPKCHPIREIDGKPNRPLTAFTAQIVRVDTEKLDI